MIGNTPRSNLGLLYSVACSIALGVIAGLPMIYRKNGAGLLVVLVVSVLVIVALSVATKFDMYAHRDGPTGKSTRTRWKPLSTVTLFVVVGSIIALVGGIVTHFISPMHPLDVLPSLAALAILGAFAGFIVGATLVSAVLISRG